MTTGGAGVGGTEACPPPGGRPGRPGAVLEVSDVTVPGGGRDSHADVIGNSSSGSASPEGACHPAGGPWPCLGHTAKSMRRNTVTAFSRAAGNSLVLHFLTGKMVKTVTSSPGKGVPPKLREKRTVKKHTRWRCRPNDFKPMLGYNGMASRVNEPQFVFSKEKKGGKYFTVPKLV